ncbi:MAG: helix-turn-helix domain-containing protein [Planctomycetes bacterium]|nr:helix-turn-helix domain-containing protein [Planctomycetota bacterium]
MNPTAALDPERCYRALASRDARFDGVFFVGVTTTGVYCRPVCRARLPKRANCVFFASATAAEREGFRPCLRCRPELAPGRAPVDAASRLAGAVAARIAAGGFNGTWVRDAARGLSVSERRFRRMVKRTLGVGPSRLAQTHRLLLAKRLLTDSSLPITSIAFASGFSSLRRFNALFRERYRLHPGALRKSAAGRERQGEKLIFTLSYRPPMAWDRLLAFLAARATPGVEVVEAGKYQRTVSLNNHRGWISVGPDETLHNLRVEMTPSLLPVLGSLLLKLRRLFDLDAEPNLIEAHLTGDPRLRSLVRRQTGLRIPGAMDGFELAVRAVLGQQVTVSAATTLAGRIAAAWNAPAETGHPSLTRYGFDAARLSSVRPARLSAIGLPMKRAEAIVRLARAVAERELDLGAGAESTIERLQDLPGIGAWTAQYIALRALHWPDAFPHSDLALRKALGGASPRDVLAAGERWRPWRGYAVMHLWSPQSIVQSP